MRANVKKDGENQVKLKLIGNFKTSVVGTQYYDNSCEVGDDIFLDRNPRNEFDSNAIEARNLSGVLGHMRREKAAWLAPLLDSGWIYLKGTALEGGDDWSFPLLVRVCVTRKGMRVLKSYSPDSAANVIHNHILSVFIEAGDYTADVIDDLRNHYRGIMAMETILPETRLLFQLLKNRAEEEQKKKAKARLEKALKILGGLKCGQNCEFRGITVIPITSSQKAGKCRYISGKKAIEDGKLVVEEVCESGVVSQVRALNNGTKPVLLVNGQGLKGAKQDRIVNITVVIAAKSSVEVPVSCVERGRWHSNSKHARFAAANFATTEIRRTIEDAARRGAENPYKEIGNSQGAVWDIVEKTAAEKAINSETENLNDVFESESSELDEAVANLAPPKDAVGMAVLKDGTQISLDIFQHPDLLTDHWSDIVKGAALVSRGNKRKEDVADEGEKIITEFLKGITLEGIESEPAPGAGEYILPRSPLLNGRMLIDSGELAHLSAFRSA